MLVEDLVQYLGFSKSYQKSYASHISRQTFKKKELIILTTLQGYHVIVGLSVKTMFPRLHEYVLLLARQLCKGSGYACFM